MSWFTSYPRNRAATRYVNDLSAPFTGIATLLKGVAVGSSISALNFTPGSGTQLMTGGVTVTGAGPGTGVVSFFDPADRVYFGTGTSTANGGTNSVTIGVGAQTSGSTRGVAIGGQDVVGQGCLAQALDCISIGPGALSMVGRSIAIGVTNVNIGNVRTSVQGAESLAIGCGATVSTGAVRCVSMGYGNFIGTNANSSVCIGDTASIGNNAAGCVVVAPLGGASNSAERSVTIGLAAQSLGSRAIAIGTDSTTPNSCVAGGGNSIAIGPGARAPFGNSIAIGLDNAAGDTGAIIIGSSNLGGGISSVTIGVATNGGVAGSVAIGPSCAAGENAIAIGQGANSSGFVASIAIGRNATANAADGNIAIGDAATAGAGQFGTSVGAQSSAAAINATAFGHTAVAGGARSTAVGSSAGGAGADSTILGYAGNGIGEDNCTMVGANALNQNGARQTCIGESCVLNVNDSVAIGRGATTDSTANNSSPLALICGGADPVNVVEAAPLVQDASLIIMVNNVRYKIHMTAFP